MQAQQLYSTSDAASVLGKTDGRVRQICIEFGIGRIVGRDRVLTASDLRRIKTLPDRRTKRFKKAQTRG